MAAGSVVGWICFYRSLGGEEKRKKAVTYKIIINLYLFLISGHYRSMGPTGLASRGEHSYSWAMGGRKERRETSWASNAHQWHWWPHNKQGLYGRGWNRQESSESASHILQLPKERTSISGYLYRKLVVIDLAGREYEVARWEI